MKLAMIIFLLCWIAGMYRQFVHLGKAETLSEECAEIGITLVWLVFGLAVFFAYTMKELP